MILRAGSVAPETGDDALGAYERAALGDAGGLTQFGVAIETLAPGAASSDRHWHADEDEFLHVLEGAGTLLDDDGAHALRPGDSVAWPAGEANGHRIENRSDAPLRYLVMGTRAPSDRVTYSDVDKIQIREDGRVRHERRDGTPLRQGETP